MTAPDSGSTHWRNLAASPGNDKVPAGRGFTNAAAEQQLPTDRTPPPLGDHGEPLDDLAATDTHEGQRGA
jgi:hypothetical protein